MSTVRGNATGDIDYDMLQNFPLQFAPLETSKTFNLNILDDDEEELDEVFFVEIKSVTHGTVSLLKETRVVIMGDQPQSDTGKKKKRGRGGGRGRGRRRKRRRRGGGRRKGGGGRR